MLPGLTNDLLHLVEIAESLQGVAQQQSGSGLAYWAISLAYWQVVLQYGTLCGKPGVMRNAEAGITRCVTAINEWET